MKKRKLTSEELLARELKAASAVEVPHRPHGKPGRKCTVCGEPVAAIASEQLCWVCRRLKISAWREQDNQAAMQE
jgi:CRISPR/Cas system-associated protein Cas10 (large subunit of type III CRISPR-Cas system)